MAVAMTVTSCGRDDQRRPRLKLALGVFLLLPQAVSCGSAPHRSASVDAAPVEPVPTRIVEFITDEVTRSNIDVSPDGRTIIFDALGDLYTVPITGGDAVPVLTGRSFESNPRFSPDGAEIAFVSDRNGSFDLWTANPDGSAEAHHTALPAGGADSVTVPEWMPIRLYPQRTPDGVSNVTHSPDSSRVAFVRNVNGLLSLILREIDTGRERVLVDSAVANWPMPHFSFTPDGRSIVLSLRGRLTRVDIATGARERIPLRVQVRKEVVEPVAPHGRVAESPDLRVRIVRWPTLSPDRERVIFSALGKLYESDTKTGATGRLTTSESFEFAPSISPDGNWLAYVTWSDSARGAVMVMPAAGGSPRRLTSQPGRYANPVWSRDGRSIAFLADAGKTQRDERFMIYWMPAFDPATAPQEVATVERYGLGRGLRFYPTVAFGGHDGRIFFTEPADGSVHHEMHGGEPSTVPWDVRPAQQLVSVQLDGSDRRVHLRISPAMDEAVLSPDARQLALSRRGHVMVAPVPADRPERPTNKVSEVPMASVSTLTEDGGTYISWQDSTTVTWGATSRVYRQRLGAPDPELVVDVDLRVPRARPAGMVAFTNARIITMRGDEVIDAGTIVVEHDRILAVGAGRNVRIPREAKVIDATGTTIIPGLGDMHAHIHGTPRELFPERRDSYIANLAFGVTTIYDPAASTLDALGQAEMVAAGAMLGPRVYSSGNSIFGVWGLEHLDHVRIESLEQAREIVSRQAAFPSRPVLKMYMQPREQRQWLVQASREAGVRMTAEGNPSEGDMLVHVLTLATDGHTAFEHYIRTWPVYDDVIQFLARSGIHWTLDLNGGSEEAARHYTAGYQVPGDDPKIVRFVPAAQHGLLRSTADDSHSADAPRGMEQWLDHMNRTAARVVRAGGVVSPGTHGGLNGLGTHVQMWAFAAGGMTNHEALRSATLAPAQKLGFERDLGSLEAGRMADFVVLDRNPLENIHNSLAIRYVVANGFVYDPESMKRVWP